MNTEIVISRNSRVAIINDSSFKISELQEALDFIATISYETNTEKIILQEENFSEEFYDLKTGLAGDILQKFTSYNVSIAIIGDFKKYKSKSFQDFIRESNRGKRALFLESKDEAIERLCS